MRRNDSSTSVGLRCVYCGGPLKRIGKGEHVIQRSLGGRREFLRCVCGDCNGAFSEIDKELASKSPLAILVQQEFGTAGALAWGYDSGHDIALEARPLPGFA